MDAETDAKYTNRVEKLLGALIALYAAIALIFDDLMVPYYSRRPFNMSAIHLHGLAAWIGALAMMLFAAIPFFGGLDDSNRLEVMPRFKYIYVLAILLAVVAVAISYLGPEGLANACAILNCTMGLVK